MPGCLQGDHFSMLLVLPNQRHGLAEVLQRLEPRHVADMLSQPGPGRRTVLFLPRFQLNTNAGLTRTLRRVSRPMPQSPVRNRFKKII